MRNKEYSCPNGCALPPRRKTLKHHDDGTYGFDYCDFTFCPNCGSLMPYSKEKLQRFFEVYTVHPLLNTAVQLLYKSEFEAAAREAFVTVENSLKKKSRLDSHGFDLATKALAFEVDKKTGEIKKEPLVAINELKNESDRNEQDGIRYMLMGFFQGPRNLYQHNHIGSGASNSISVVIEASFFLRLLDGHSITKNGQWLRTKIDFQDMINKTPKLIDRWKLLRLLKKCARMPDENQEKRTPKSLINICDLMPETVEAKYPN